MTNLPERAGPSDPRALRASDADRDRVARLLRDAAGEGRIGMDELDERLTAVYAAKTYADLEPITGDLPAYGDHPATVPAESGPARIGGTATSSTAIAIMGGFERAGSWTAPSRFTAFALWGGGAIDLRDARFATREVRIIAIAIMGGIDIIVPEDIEVDVSGIGIMGGFDQRASGPPVNATSGAPRVKVSGFAFWGGVSTRRKARKIAKRQGKELG